MSMWDHFLWHHRLVSPPKRISNCRRDIMGGARTEQALGFFKWENVEWKCHFQYLSMSLSFSFTIFHSLSFNCTAGDKPQLSGDHQKRWRILGLLGGKESHTLQLALSAYCLSSYLLAHTSMLLLNILASATKNINQICSWSLFMSPSGGAKTYIRVTQLQWKSHFVPRFHYFQL